VEGFFSASEVSVKPASTAYTIPRCGACGLLKTCQSPKMPVTGKGRKGILVVAEAPGYEEDKLNEQLIGPAGQLLRQSLAGYGIDLDRDCWKTNALICRPPENATPTNDQIDWCRPNFLRTVEDLQPELILPLGGAAARCVLAPFWRDDFGGITKWVGWHIPLQKWNCWVAPNSHPSRLLHTKDDNNGPVVRLWFEKYLEAALTLQGSRPWQTVPNYAKEIRLIFDPDEAAAWIREGTARGQASAFDYETNMLKPDSDLAEIVTCSISWAGRNTAAFPWTGAVIPAMREYLSSPIPKIGANNGFEDRWSRRKVGVRVKWVDLGYPCCQLTTWITDRRSHQSSSRPWSG